MAKNTVDIQKMKTAASELEQIHSSMQTQLKKLDEQISALKGVWTGEAANTYLNGYQQNYSDVQNLSAAIKSASAALTSIAAHYSKADMEASEIVKQKLARG